MIEYKKALVRQRKWFLSSLYKQVEEIVDIGNKLVSKGVVYVIIGICYIRIDEEWLRMERVRK